MKPVMLTVAVLISVSAFVVLNNAEADCSSAQITETGRCGDDLTYSLSADGTLVISGNGEMYDYYENTAPMIKCCENVTKIVIEDGVTSVGEWAFRGCVNVRELIMPGSINSVKSNAHAAFAGCTNIEKVSFTGTKPVCDYDAYPVNDRWYQNTPWYQSRATLKEINFADGIKGIGSDAFRELNITSLVIPDSVTGLGNHTFYNCEKLTELTYPISLKPFCNDKYPAFNGCKAIQKVTFTNGNGVPYDYDYGGFYGGAGADLAPWNINPDVSKTIVFSDSVGRLGRHMFNVDKPDIKEIFLPITIDFDKSKYAFQGLKGDLEKVTVTKGTGADCDFGSNCKEATPWNSVSSVKTVIVEEGVTRIGCGTFKDCTIENLVLPNSLVSFGCGKSFQRCTVKNLTIPISVNATWIDNTPAFMDVTGLEKVTFTPGDTGMGFNYNANEGGNNHYLYTPWHYSRTLKEIVFEDGIKSIGNYAFYKCGSITSIKIPDSVRSIGVSAFSNCTSLTTAYIGKSVTELGEEAFGGCTALTNVTSWDSTNLDQKAFVGCDNIKMYIGEAYFTVVFKDGDTVLQTLTVRYKTCPEYTEPFPVREPTEQYTYKFKGWDHEIVAVTGDASYAAEFTESLREYTITFKNGEDILRKSLVPYGETPVFTGDEPTREPTAGHSYRFSGWSP